MKPYEGTFRFAGGQSDAEETRARVRKTGAKTAKVLDLIITTATNGSVSGLAQESLLTGPGVTHLSDAVCAEHIQLASPLTCLSAMHYVAYISKAELEALTWL